MSPTPTYQVPEPQGPNWKTPLVAGALIVLAATNVYLYVQVDRTRGEIGKMRESILSEVTNLRDASSVSTQSQKQRIETLKEELETARRQAAMGASQAKAEATARAEQLAKRLEIEQAKVHQQVTSEISAVKQEVKQESTTAQQKFAEVNTEVGGVKSQVAANKSELDKTIADLKRVTGDLGVQSGLIATNSTELAALRRLGERNYFEFKLGKTKQPQRVGDITLLLRKTDQKKNKYTVEVMADDKRTEKKDKNINEPVQFYTSKARQPYELVVNKVDKDLIVGYLATPKETTPR